NQLKTAANALQDAARKQQQPATQQATPVDIEQVAGRNAPAPAPTSGGGSSTTSAVPPSVEDLTPAAPTPGLEQLGLQFAGGAPNYIPAFEDGGIVESTGLALVHEGETVIPARSSFADYADPTHPVAKAINAIFGQPEGDEYRGLTGAPDPSDPD